MGVSQDNPRACLGSVGKKAGVGMQTSGSALALDYLRGKPAYCPDKLCSFTVSLRGDGSKKLQLNKNSN